VEEVLQTLKDAGTEEANSLLEYIPDTALDR
jgi:hypothetical protein